MGPHDNRRPRTRTTLHTGRRAPRRHRRTRAGRRDALLPAPAGAEPRRESRGAAGRVARVRVVRRNPGGRAGHQRLVLPARTRRRTLVGAGAAVRRPDPVRAEPGAATCGFGEVWLLWTSQHAGNQDTARVHAPRSPPTAATNVGPSRTHCCRKPRRAACSSASPWPHCRPAGCCCRSSTACASRAASGSATATTAP